MSYLSLLTEEDRVEEVERETYNTRSNRLRSIIGGKVRRKFHRRMEIFVSEGGSCGYAIMSA